MQEEQPPVADTSADRRPSSLFADLAAQHATPMLVIDPDDGAILAANAASAAFYGWTVDELASMRIADINVHPVAEVQREMAAACAQHRAYFAFRHRTASGEVRDVEVYSSPLEVDGRRLLGSLIHDATERHAAAWQLHESERFNRAIVSQALVGIAVARLDGRLVRVNRALCEITGYSEQELLERNVRSLTHPEDRAETEAAFHRLLAGETDQYRFEKRYLRRDGSTAEVEVTGTLLHDRDGSPRHQVGVILDRTAERRAQDEAARASRDLSCMMQSVNVGILLLDGDWRVTYLNPRGQELLGVAVADLIGVDLREEFASQLGRGFHRACATAMMSGRSQTVVERFSTTGAWFEARAHPGRPGLVISFTDVTDRVEHRARTEHQARLERLAATARSHAAELEAQHETRNAFLSAVSHELRTPMTVVHGLAETLAHRRAALDPGTRAQLEDALLEQSGRMAALLEQLLDVDRLARGALIAERSRLDLARQVVALVDASPVADRVTLEGPAHLDGWVDPVQFERIVVNLLGNVAKYAPEGTVWLRLRQGPAGRVRLEVEDEGPGIAIEERERVFAPFQRLDDDHPQPGTGIGLALVAEFARLHDGRAWIEDAVGTCVVVELDATEPLTQEQAAS